MAAAGVGAGSPMNFTPEIPGKQVFVEKNVTCVDIVARNIKQKVLAVRESARTFFKFLYLGISSIKHRPAKATCDKKIRVVHEKNPLTDIEPSD